MPQADKSDFEQTSSGRSDLEGRTFEPATDPERLDVLQKAFDYRGDVTLTLRDGATIEGFIHNVSPTANLVSLFAKLSKRESENAAVPLDQIVKVQFSGEDTAFGKSWDDWTAKSAAQREKEAQRLRQEAIERGEL